MARSLPCCETESTICAEYLHHVCALRQNSYIEYFSRIFPYTAKDRLGFSREILTSLAIPGFTILMIHRERFLSHCARSDSSNDPSRIRTQVPN